MEGDKSHKSKVNLLIKVKPITHVTRTWYETSHLLNVDSLGKKMMENRVGAIIYTLRRQYATGAE